MTGKKCNLIDRIMVMYHGVSSTELQDELDGQDTSAGPVSCGIMERRVPEQEEAFHRRVRRARAASPPQCKAPSHGTDILDELMATAPDPAVDV